MKRYKAVIVDDEDKNLKLLNHFIEKFCLNINIISSNKSLKGLVSIIEKEKPDILYLDIKLSKGTTFELFETLDYKDFAIIFITAHKDFAIKAIKLNVIDYILKPLSIEDLILATNKAILAVEEKENRKHSIEDSSIITIHNLDKIEIVKKEDLIYCESDGRYTTFFLKNEKKITASKNLGYYESILKRGFVRIHNSYIINVVYIKVINKKNGFFCEMINGKKIPVSKRKQPLLINM